MPNIISKQDDQFSTYAYTVFDTSKLSPHYNIIKKCVDFKKYVTHKLIINTSTKIYEYTFLRLAYSKQPAFDAVANSDGWISESWQTSTNTLNGKKPFQDIDTIIEGAKHKSIIGTSLMDMIPAIFTNINNSTSFILDGKSVNRSESLYEYIHSFLDKIYETDPILLISLCICPREYFMVDDYIEYARYFMQIIKSIIDKIASNATYASKYHLDRSILIQIARIFANTIRSDYLFLSTDILLNMLNFIVDARIINNATCDKPLHYDVINNFAEIAITGSKIKDVNSDEYRFKQMAIRDTPSFYNPYELVELTQYINLKLVSENKKPLKLSLKNTDVEMYSFVQNTSQEYEDTRSSYMMGFNWSFNNLDNFDVPRPYKISYRTTVRYEHMSKILTKKQKNIFVKATIDNINNINLNDVDVILNNPKYSYGVCIIKEMLCTLIGEDAIEKDKTPLNIVIDNFITNDPRSTMLLKIYNSVRDRNKLAVLILDYLSDDDIKVKETFDLINRFIYTDNPFNINWFNSHKDVIVDALRIRYKLSDKINTDQLYAFYLFTHCPEFVKKEFITSVTNALIKNKNTNSNALNNIIDSFFQKQKSSDILAFLDELQSALMKDLFISIFNLKASQQMLIFEMTDELSKSTEIEELSRNAIKLADAKSIHYATCEHLLDTAYKSTNSFRSKIVDLLKENVTSTVFSSNKKKINNDARIALFADLLRALSKSFLTIEEQCKIANQYDNSRYETLYPYRIDDMSGVMKALSLVPECPSEISVFFTEKYLQEH